MLKTRSQRYAADIYKRVLTVKELPNPKVRDEFLSLVRSFPVLVKTAGLMQALAFLHSKAKYQQNGEQGDVNAHALLLNNLSQSVIGGPGEQPDGQNSLLLKCWTEPLSEYMRLTRESLEALLWYKRFSEALLKD